MANEIINEVKQELHKSMLELIAAGCILIIMLLLFYLRMNYVVSIIGGVMILAIAFERRGSRFDKVVAMLVIFFLALSFMFL